MTAARIGSVVSLYYDDPEKPLEEGHVVLTSNGRAYRITGLRRARLGVYVGHRWYLTARVMAPHAITTEDVVHPLNWYPRSRR